MIPVDFCTYMQIKWFAEGEFASLEKLVITCFCFSVILQSVSHTFDSFNLHSNVQKVEDFIAILEM